jgi:hypothetical protein
MIDIRQQTTRSQKRSRRSQDISSFQKTTEHVRFGNENRLVAMIQNIIHDRLIIGKGPPGMSLKDASLLADRVSTTSHVRADTLFRFG